MLYFYNTLNKIALGSYNKILIFFFLVLLQSLDYEIVENYVYRDEERKKGYPFVVKKSVVRWIVFFWIGVITATIGIIIDLSIENLADIKFAHVKECILLYLLQTV